MIRRGDSRDLGFIEDHSVHLVVTSPPYVTTEFYEGQEFDYSGYLAMVAAVFKELFRVVVPDGRFALNIANIFTKYRYEDDERLHRIPLALDTFRAAEEAGFRMFDEFIWDKGFTRNFKGPLLGSYPFPASIHNNVYYEYIYILRKPGRRRVPQVQRDRSRIAQEDWKSYVQKWWRVESISERYDGHAAVFPVEIPRRLIKLYSFHGDTVLDPFLGTGTTTQAARDLGRNSIGVEVNPSYRKLIQERLEPAQLTLDHVETTATITWERWQ